MACVSELHINDDGTSIEIELVKCAIDGTTSAVDLSTATSTVYRFVDPLKVSTDKPAIIFAGGVNGDGTDGILQYITEAGFIVTKGTWKVQAIVAFPTGLFHSSINKFTVANNLPVPP